MRCVVVDFFSEKYEAFDELRLCEERAAEEKRVVSVAH